MRRPSGLAVRVGCAARVASDVRRLRQERGTGTAPHGVGRDARGRCMVGIVVWVACALFAAGMVCDLRSRRIPNAIPLALLGLFAVYAAAGEAGPLQAMWVNLAIGAVLLAAGFALYLTGGFGAGDGKLIAVAGIWIGPADLSLFLLGLAAGAGRPRRGRCRRGGAARTRGPCSGRRIRCRGWWCRRAQWRRPRIAARLRPGRSAPPHAATGLRARTIDSGV